MKLERLHEYILPTVVTLIGMGFAAYCGTLSGNGQTSTLAALLGGVVLVALFLICRAKIWMLLPVTSAMTGSIPILPVQFSPRDLTVMVVFTFFLVLMAARAIRVRPKFQTVDWWMFAMLFYLGTVYLRNPVGFEMLGADRVGARPYFNIIISCLAYWTLTRSLLAPGEVIFLILATTFGHLFIGVLDFITYHFPETVPILSLIYSEVEKSAYDAQDVNFMTSSDGPSRQPTLLLIGNPLVILVLAFCRPLTAINPLYIFRFIVLMLGFAAVFASGFRSAFAANFALLFIASYMRRGLQDVMRLGMLILPVMLIMIAGQGVFFDLPYPAQRALSFVPYVNWNPTAIEDTKASTEWRQEMWRATLSEDKYLRNKWLGDGFGFSQRDLAMMIANQASGTPEGQAENQLIAGGVHSGPVSAIRYVGIVGLLIYLALLFVTAQTAWKLIRRSEGTKYYPLALFIGLPVLWEPINYIFIFGGYDASMPTTIFNIGLLKMLSHSLDTYATKAAPAAEEEPESTPESSWKRQPSLVGARRSAYPGA